MKKHEKLEKAMNDYPDGTVFDSISNYVSTGKFITYKDYFNSHAHKDSIYSINKFAQVQGIIFDGAIGKWAEIVKPKIAVKVSSQKEINAVFNHFKFDKDPFTHTFFSCSEMVIYVNGNIHGEFDLLNDKREDYQIIAFAEFAQEKGIKLPLIVSEDGFDLYEGDDFFSVRISNYDIVERALTKDWAGINSGNLVKGFSTKQAALDWIDAQKPKEIEVEIGDRDLKAIIFKDGSDCLSFKQRGKMVNIAHLTFKEMRDINDAMANI